MSEQTPAARPARVFLDGPRARAWAGALGVGGAVVLLAMLATSHGGMDVLGRPVGTDFASFWTAAGLALQQGGAAAYDVPTHAAAQAAAFPREPGQPALYYAFFYPPPFLLVCLWLGYLPYLPALVAWLAAGFLLLLACVRRLLPMAWPWRWAALGLAGFPGVLQNALSGQNGCLSAACFGGAAVLARRPFWAGACLGLLVCKPQLLIAAPVVLLAGRRWAAIAGGVCSAALLCGVSWLVLGPAAWTGFLAGARAAKDTLEQALVPPDKMVSAFAAIRVLGGGLAPAYAVQGGLTALTMLVAAMCAAPRPGLRAEVMLLTAGAMLCSPFLLDYDLVCLAVPLAWLVAQAEAHGFRPFEKPVLVAAYAMPLLARPLATYALVPVAPIIVALLLWVVAGRATRAPSLSV